MWSFILLQRAMFTVLEDATLLAVESVTDRVVWATVWHPTQRAQVSVSAEVNKVYRDQSFNN